MKEILSQVQSNIIETVVTLVVCAAGYLLFSFFFKKQIEEKRKRDKILSRIKYIFIAFATLFIFQIWIQGFFEILAFIGFLSAGITITQKDNLMNIVGFLIITWRELFLEGDLIKISNYTGIVKSIGFLYFTVQEVDETMYNEFTGRIVKIPNGWVSKNPLINYTAEKIHKTTLSFVFTKDTEIATLGRILDGLTEDIKHYLRKTFDYHESLISKVYVHHILNLKQSKPIGIEAKLNCYSPLLIKNEVIEFIHIRMFEYRNGESGICLAFE
ncbi:MAG: mechanosensitive ion channel [Gammaproteobacteria bacterium]